MGYRSEIKICMHKENFEELKNRIKNIDNDDKTLIDKDLDYFQDFDDIVVFGWDWLKWYKGYEFVDIVEEYLNELSKKEIEYKFIRIGEEYGDISVEEIYGSGKCDRIYCTQEILVD